MPIRRGALPVLLLSLAWLPGCGSAPKAPEGPPMRGYVLVILKTGPNPVPAGVARDEMFKGHFANIQKLSDAGKLVLAGPLDGVEGRRGIFVLAVTEVEDARAIVATDPVIARGEMVPEFHKFYGSAALTQLPELHKKLTGGS